MISKRNTSSETIPCLRRTCPGVAPGTEHRPSTTANMCEVVDVFPVEFSPEVQARREARTAEIIDDIKRERARR